MKLSEHFTLDEFTTSQTAARLAIGNNPGAVEIKNLHRLAEALEKVRAIHGSPLTISSGYRSPNLNSAIGGSRNSAHQYGLAADINVPGIPPRDLAHAIIAAGIEFDQLIFEGTWVHFALSSGKLRNETLTAHFGNGKVKYTAGIP